MNKFRIDFNQILQPHTKTDKIYFQLPMDIQQALEYCRYMLQQELNLFAQDIYNGFTIEQVLDFRTCPNCGKTFEPDHGNKKYCSDECVKNANKIKNAERVKKYLSVEQNHKKHLIRLKTNNKFRKLNQDKKCAMCGSVQNIQNHHLIYDNNYVQLVIHLCKKCHEKLHKEMK